VKRPCKDCKGPYKDHIDYTFEHAKGNLLKALKDALPKVKCMFYKPMSNLVYLEWLSKQNE
jgi:hypothetical protein